MDSDNSPLRLDQIDPSEEFTHFKQVAWAKELWKFELVSGETWYLPVYTIAQEITSGNS